MKKNTLINSNVVKDLLKSILKNNNYEYGKYSISYFNNDFVTVTYSEKDLEYKSLYPDNQILLIVAYSEYSLGDLKIEKKNKLEYLYIDFDHKNDKFVIKESDNFSPDYEKRVKAHNVFPISKYKREDLEHIIRVRFSQAIANILKENIA